MCFLLYVIKKYARDNLSVSFDKLSHDLGDMALNSLDVISFHNISLAVVISFIFSMYFFNLLNVLINHANSFPTQTNLKLTCLLRNPDSFLRRLIPITKRRTYFIVYIQFHIENKSIVALILNKNFSIN